MCIKPKSMKSLYVPKFYLNDNVLKEVETYKYLGVVISNTFTDDCDIMRLTRSIYATGNVLISKFKKCTDDVKIQLFKTYLTNLYCSHLWSSFFTV